MTLPNFLIIGAAKSGTTSLAHYLEQHPQVYMCPIKEPCFFADGGQEVNFAGPGDHEFYGYIVRDINKYHSLFDNVEHEYAIGEASVIYLYSQTAPIWIKQYIPDVKLIAILRNPVDRAFSSYSHLRRDVREPLTDFSEALQAEETRVKANWQHIWYYTRLGLYHEQLNRYFTLFPLNQIKIFTYDEFRANPVKVVQDIFCFLEVDASFIPDMSLKYNQAGTPKLMGIHKFLVRSSRTKTLAKLLIPASTRSQMRSLIMRWNIAGEKPKFPQEARQYLSEFYRDDIVKLQSLIQKDLSEWLKS